MKRILAGLGVSVGLVCAANAQDAAISPAGAALGAVNTGGTAAKPAYSAIEQGPNHKVWQWVESEPTADGPAPRIHKYT
jgi:hypothetical protein